jgi:hypothetical protein
MNKLLNLVDQLALQIPNANALNSNVSNANTAWHIEHSCLVIIKITETLQKSDPEKFQTKFNFKKIFVFLIGKFPRGRAKAPEVVMPIENITTSHLEQSILKTKAAIVDLQNCEKNNHFSHPIFGSLNATETIKFLGIHTNHHLLIIRDILK